MPRKKFVNLTLICERCGKEYTVKNYAETRGRRFCELSCFRAWQKENPKPKPEPKEPKVPVELICPTCGEAFVVPNRDKNRRKFCSSLCANRGRKRNKKYREGYIYQYCEERGKYLAEHRLVMEAHIGRRLTAKEVVHHNNEIRDDNRIENLTLFANSSEHTAHHWNKGDRWAVDYDRCKDCGTTERKHTAFGLCKRCWDRDYRRRKKELADHVQKNLANRG